MGGYPASNRELTVPHTVALPIELYPPYLAFIVHKKNNFPFFFSAPGLQLID